MKTCSSDNGTITDKINKLEIEKRPFIDGKYTSSIAKEIVSKLSPADGRDISGINVCDKDDVNIAVSVAKKAYEEKTWCGKTVEERKKTLFKLADLIAENREELALLDTLETGRAYRNYYYDSIPKAIEAIRWFAEAVDKSYDKTISQGRGSFATIVKEPLGVVALIVPWNDPLVVSAWKFAPALLMGNSIIVKPAEQSSFSILRIAKLAYDAGIPKGVFNVITGYGEVAGKELVLHKDVSAVFFTGSSDTGKRIFEYCAKSNIKKIGLECGGKSPFIISENCKNIEQAITVLTKNIFYNQGQICSAPSRLIIHRTLKDRVIPLLQKEVKKYIPGNPFDVDSEVGCVVSKEQKIRIENYIESGIKAGYRVIEYDHGTQDIPECSIFPVIFDNVDSDSKIAQEEIFGPVLSIIAVDNMAEAVEIANNSKYGLAAAIWSDDINEAHQVSRALQAGIVHINSYGDDDNTVPFGGIKDSGIGKDKSFYAFDEYSITKTIWVNLDG